MLLRCMSSACGVLLVSLDRWKWQICLVAAQYYFTTFRLYFFSSIDGGFWRSFGMRFVGIRCR